MNALSVLPNANVSLPVRALTLVGGSTPRLARYFAKIWLLINVLVIASSLIPVSPMSVMRVRFLALTSSRCCSKSSLSSSMLGSVYMRSVWSMTINSLVGKPLLSFLNKLYVNSTSFLQYSPYRAISSGVNADFLLPNALRTSSPF